MLEKRHVSMPSLGARVFTTGIWNKMPGKPNKRSELESRHENSTGKTLSRILRLC